MAGLKYVGAAVAARTGSMIVDCGGRGCRICKNRTNNGSPNSASKQSLVFRQYSEDDPNATYHLGLGVPRRVHRKGVVQEDCQSLPETE